MNEYKYSHSLEVAEVTGPGKYSRKSAPPAIRAIPRTNKRFKKSPFTVEQMESISSEYIFPYENIYKNSIIGYTERKIKSKKKCELFRKFMFERENDYFSNLKKCVIYDTDWIKEKCKRDESELINSTNNETTSTLDIYLLRSVVSEKLIKQRNLLLKLKEFWKDFPNQLKEKMATEKELVMDKIGVFINTGKSNRNFEISKVELTSDNSNESTQSPQNVATEQPEQIDLIVNGYDVTTRKLSYMVEKLSERIEQILGIERRLHNVANALIINS